MIYFSFLTDLRNLKVTGIFWLLEQVGDERISCYARWHPFINTRHRMAYVALWQKNTLPSTQVPKGTKILHMAWQGNTVNQFLHKQSSKLPLAKYWFPHQVSHLVNFYFRSLEQHKLHSPPPFCPLNNRVRQVKMRMTRPKSPSQHRLWQNGDLNLVFSFLSPITLGIKPHQICGEKYLYALGVS